MIDNKNKRQLLYLNTRKYKLKGFVKNNNNKLTKENLKFQETKHIQEVINKLQNNNKKTLKDKEKLRYQEAKNKQKHIDKVIKKTQEINNKREEREEKILKEKINNLAKGITEIDIEDKNKESELSFNESFDSTASTTDEENEDNRVSVSDIDKYTPNNYKMFNPLNDKKQDNKANIPIWRQNNRKNLHDNNKKIEHFIKPIKKDKPVKLFLRSGFQSEISAEKAEENERNMQIKKFLRSVDMKNQKTKKVNNEKPIKLFLSSGRASHKANFK